MDLGKKLKDFIVSSFVSLSKAEQDMLREVIIGSSDGSDMQQEQQVRKNHIKLLSQKRFYEILDRADQFIAERDKEKLKLLMEQRGFLETDQSFKNQTYTSTFDDGRNPEYKFRTDNGMFRFANLLNVSDHPNGKLLKFFINEKEHPSIRTQAMHLSKLGYIEFNEGVASYAYRIQRSENIERVSPFEIALTFVATCEQNGVTEQYSDEEQYIHKHDLDVEKAKTYTYGGGGHQAPGLRYLKG